MGYLLLLQIMLFIFTRTCSTTPTYGPYRVKVLGMDLCAGPRHKNCTIIDTSAIVVNEGTLSEVFKVVDNVSPTKAKIVAQSNGKDLVRFQMDKPCEHMFIRPLFETLFNITKNCVVRKGDYKLKVDINDMLPAYFGEKFFYGNLSFKAVIYGSDCNFSCINIFLAVIPKQ